MSVTPKAPAAMTDAERMAAIRDRQRGRTYSEKSAEREDEFLLRQLDAALAEIADLRQKMNDAEATCDSYASENQRFHDRFTAAEARIAVLREALRKYGQHIIPLCNQAFHHSRKLPWTCGFDAALAKEPPRWVPTHRHYKGGLYRLLLVALHTEAHENMAIYQSEDGMRWARPLEMFNDTLPDGRKRFTAIEDPP